MRVDGQCLAILAHHLQAGEPQVVQVTPGGGEIQLQADAMVDARLWRGDIRDRGTGGQLWLQAPVIGPRAGLGFFF